MIAWPWAFGLGVLGGIVGAGVVLSLVVAGALTARHRIRGRR